MPKRTGVSLAVLRALLFRLPEVEEGPCYGTPGFRVRGKVLARLWEDGETLVVKCGDEERDFRLEDDPRTFFVADHYRGYPAVLVRLTRVSVPVLREVIERAWCLNAPPKLVAARAGGVKAPAARTRRAKARRTRR
jgi:hypothetical protein